MRVGIYGKARQPDLAAVAAGFRRLGHAVEFCGLANFQPAADVRAFDQVVTLGQKSHSRAVADAYRARGVPVWVVDLPVLRWPHLDNHRALWAGEINRLPAVAPPDRFESFGIRLHKRRRPGPVALICGQMGNDAAHGRSAREIRLWAERAADRARGFGLDPVWRPHPRDGFNVPGLPISSAPLDVDLARPLRVVVTINSTVGLKAIAAGVPVVCDDGCFYREIAAKFASDWREPHWPTPEQRRGFFSRGAYTQWSSEELAAGSAVSLSARLWPESRLAA